MRKPMIIWGALFGMCGVVLGALGAHALKDHLTSELLQSFETGVRYQVFHAILLLSLGFQNAIETKWISRLLIIGIFLFSGSIYLLSCRDLLEMPSLKLLGPITPIGGLLLISAWGLLLQKAVTYSDSK